MLLGPPRLGRVPLGIALFLGGAASAPLSASQDPGLLDAARRRNWDAIRSLVEAEADVNATAPDGATALHWVAYWDDVETAEFLLDEGADANAANDQGATPLWNASLNGSGDMVRLLLDAGADPNAPLLAGETPVLTGARTGDPEVLDLLLEAGGDPNVKGSRGQTPLMWAAAQRHPDAVRILLESGADVHARSDTWIQVMAVPPHSQPENQQAVPHGGNTPLLMAARVGDLPSARLLVDAGSDLDATDAWGVSPVVYAAHSGFEDLVDFLLGAGADPNVADAGFSALHLAVLRRNEGMARSLLEHGADPNAPIETWTPTRRASNDWSIHPSLVGATPFWMAARFSQPRVMRLLAVHGGDAHFVHHADYIGSAGAFGATRVQESTTTLMAAVGMGGPRRLGAFVDPGPLELEALALEAVRICVELGVDLHAQDSEGRTALEAASFPSIAEFLAAAQSGQP